MKSFTFIAFVIIVIAATVNALCSSTKWKIYLAGSPLGHQFVLALPQNAGSAVHIPEKQCLKVELTADKGKTSTSASTSSKKTGGDNSHRVRRSKRCDDNNSFKFTICAPESEFTKAKDASIKCDGNGDPKKYNILTNNCQGFASRVLKHLSKFKVQASLLRA
jgi:hypothetical protein